MLKKYDDILLVNLDKLTYAGNLENLKGCEGDTQVLYKGFHPNESNSTVIVNSCKARLLWIEHISKLCDFERLNIDEEIKRNKQLRKPFERQEIREDVYKDLDSFLYNSKCR